MFYGCTSLTQAPTLPATTLENYCYNGMFKGCTSLTQAPALPATTMASYCYNGMFYNCTSLTQAPALPATTLAINCYEYMFYGCTSLTQAPALPATTLGNYCYNGMFKGCTNLKLSSTRTGEYTQEYRISSGEGVTTLNALLNMFTSTGGTFTGTPAINTTYYLSSDNMIVRDTEVATLNGYVGSMIDVAIKYVDDSVSNPLNITGATVGQIAKITAVDDTGQPTVWEAVDMPSGGVALDTTLTQSGQAADAAVVGNRLSALSEEIANIPSGKTAYQYAVEGGYTGTETAFAEKLAQEQLSGTTDELTPTQVYDAVSAGIPVKAQYLDSTYGLISFMAFNVSESLNVIASHIIAYFNGLYILCELYGDKSSNTWGFNATTLAQKTDIPTALPNPNALTFTGAVTGSYDGSEALTVEIPSAVTDDHINSLIDTKLGVIENGSY